MVYWNEQSRDQSDTYSVPQMNISAENGSSISNSQTDSSIQSKPQSVAMDFDGVYSSSNYSEENESSSSFDGNKSISTSKNSLVEGGSASNDDDSPVSRSAKWSLKECTDLQKAVKMYGTHDQWSEIATCKRVIAE